ncbi:MAG: hypothetical protein ACRC0Y_07270 [Fusobacteriaceae bacterium]
MPEGGLGGKSGGGGPSTHIFYSRKETAAYIPYLCPKYMPSSRLDPAGYRLSQKAGFLEEKITIKNGDIAIYLAISPFFLFFYYT